MNFDEITCPNCKESNDLDVIDDAQYGCEGDATLQCLNCKCEFIKGYWTSYMDDETIINSVKKTGRCIVVHEGPRSCGFAAEIIARINEKALLSLEAPVKRITGYDTIIPLAKLEDKYLPSVKRIMHGIEEVLGF